jgi:hypothetical protein
MAQDADIRTLVDGIYAAAVDPGCWQGALNQFCALYPEGHATLLEHDLTTEAGSFTIVSCDWDPRWVDAYNVHYSRVNPWLKHLKKRPVGLAVPAEYMLDRASLVKTEFYSDFLRPQNMLSGVGVTIDQSEDRFVAISALLPERSSRDERRNVDLLQRLAPHFRLALQLNRQLDRIKLDSEVAETALHELAIGFVLVDASCKVLFENRAAEQILRAGDGLGLDRNGVITALSSGDTGGLHGAVAHAATILDVALGGNGPALRIGRPSGKPAYSITAAPLRPRHPILGTNDAVVAIVISDQARE